MSDSPALIALTLGIGVFGSASKTFPPQAPPNAEIEPGGLPGDAPSA
ncbi:MAG: hypothetical protein ACIARR_00560 [Phycisphaerales bacterium JB059]